MNGDAITGSNYTNVNFAAINQVLWQR
jgi:hypothetical protein